MAPRDFTEELDECWREIRVRKIEITSEAEGFEAIIEKAAKRVQQTVRDPLLTRVSGQQLSDPDVLIGVVTLVAQAFVHALVDEQKKQDSTVLIQLFLESATSLAPDDLRGFLRALPRDMINRILIGLESQPHTGLQALLSIEALWRDRSLDRDYEIRREPDGKLVVSFFPSEAPGGLQFRLRELLGSAR